MVDHHDRRGHGRTEGRGADEEVNIIHTIGDKIKTEGGKRRRVHNTRRDSCLRRSFLPVLLLPFLSLLLLQHYGLQWGPTASTARTQTSRNDGKEGMPCWGSSPGQTAEEQNQTSPPGNKPEGNGEGGSKVGEIAPIARKL